MHVWGGGERALAALGQICPAIDSSCKLRDRSVPIHRVFIFCEIKVKIGVFFYKNETINFLEIKVLFN